MQIAPRIILLISALIVECWANDYPIPKTRALNDAFTKAYYNPSAAKIIRYDIIQDALNELLAIPQEVREQLSGHISGRSIVARFCHRSCGCVFCWADER